MKAPTATSSGLSIGSGLSINTPPLPQVGGGGSATTSRPYAGLGKMSASVFPSTVAPRMNPTTGAYVDPEMLHAREQQRAPLAGIPILGNITGGIQTFLDSPILGDIIAPEHAVRRSVVWSEGVNDPDREKWQRMVDTNSMSLADAQARFLREHLARMNKDGLFLNWVAPGDNSAIAQLAAKVGAATSAAQYMTLKAGVGLQVGPILFGGRPTANRIEELQNATDDDLEHNDVLIGIRDGYRNGTINQNDAMDQLIVAGFGAMNPAGKQYGPILGGAISGINELTTDPLSLLEMGVGTLAKAATIAGRQSEKFLIREGGEAFLEELTKRAAAKGYSVSRRGTTDILIREAMSQPESLAVLERAMAKAPRGVRWLVMDAPRIHALGTKISTILDPLSFFGRDEIGALTTKQFSRKAATGVIAGFGGRNIRKTRALIASTLGEEVATRLDDAFDRAGMQVAIQAGNDATIHHVRASNQLDGLLGEDPTQIAMGEARRMGNDITRVVADKVERIKLRYLPLSVGEAGVQTMLEGARKRATSQLANIAGISEADAAKVTARMSESQLSLLDFQHYGHVIGDFLEARKIASTGGEQIAGVTADRATFMGPRQLTKKVFKEFKKALKANRMDDVRQMIEQYDDLYGHYSLEASNAELKKMIGDTIDQIGKQLPTSIEDLDKAPASLRAFIDRYGQMGYKLGLMPSEEDIYRPITRNGVTVSVNPWVDYVDDRLARMAVSRIQAGRGILFRNISGSAVVRDAMTRFVRLSAERYGMSESQGREMFRAIQRAAGDRYTTARALSSQEMWDAAWKADLPSSLRRQVTERALAEMTLQAHEGSLATVGLTQKFTGSAKTSIMKATGINIGGIMAERVYPIMRFTINPMFQAMEAVETPVLLLMRGYVPFGDLRKMATSQGRKDLREEIAQTMHVMETLDRTRPTGKAWIDQREMIDTLHRGGEYAINHAIGRVGLVDKMLRLYGRLVPNVHAIKEWGEVRAFEYREAENMAGAIAGASPESWRNYTTWAMQRSRFNTDRDAIRHFLYDMVAKANPESAYARLGPAAFKPHHLGAGVRVHPQFVASLVYGETEAAQLGLGKLRKRVKDVSDPLNGQTIEDALRAVGADPVYIERAVALFTAPSPKEHYRALEALGRTKEEVNAWRIEDKRVAEERGMNLDEYIARRFENAPGSIDAVGRVTDPTLFQQIADAFSARGTEVLAADHPKVLRMMRLAEQYPPSMERAAAGTPVKAMTDAQKKGHQWDGARDKRAVDETVGQTPTDTVRVVPATGEASVETLSASIKTAVAGSRKQADELDAQLALVREAKGVLEGMFSVSRPSAAALADANKVIRKAEKKIAKIRRGAAEFETGAGRILAGPSASDQAVRAEIDAAFDAGDIEKGNKLIEEHALHGGERGARAHATEVGTVVRDGRSWHRFKALSGDEWWEQTRNVLGQGSDDSPILRELADWYQDMRRGFMGYANNDPELAAKLLVGFGISQLNTSPPDGMRFLLRAEAMARRGQKLPIDETVTGLNTELMKKLFEDGMLDAKGLGQKLLDFIDSLIGKKTRTAGVHGPDVENPWQPVAGDIWAKRDLGFVDAKMTNHLAFMYGVPARNVIYHKDVGFVIRDGEKVHNIPASKVTGSSPSDVEYDYIVEFYNKRKDEANAMPNGGWLGRNNWTAAEMQAVGWFRAKVAMGDSSGSPLDALFRNRHSVAWEAVPSVNAPLYKQFPLADAHPSTIRAVTDIVGKHIAREAEEATGVRVISHYGSAGPWQSDAGDFSMVPNMVFEVASGHPKDVWAFSAAAAYLSQQEGIPASRPLKGGLPKPGEGQLWAVDWAPAEGARGANKAEAERALDELVATNDIARAGATLVRYDDGSYGIRAVAVPGTSKTVPEEWWSKATISNKDFTSAWTDEMLGEGVHHEGISFVPQRTPVESQYHFHDWEADPSGEGILQELRDAGYGSTADKLAGPAKSRTRLIYEDTWNRVDRRGLAEWRTLNAVDDPQWEQRAAALFNDHSADDVAARAERAIGDGEFLFQRVPRGTLGAVSFNASRANRASLYLNPVGQRRDTLLHELSHVFAEQELDPSAKIALLKVYNDARASDTLTRRGRKPAAAAAPPEPPPAAAPEPPPAAAAPEPPPAAPVEAAAPPVEDTLEAVTTVYHEVARPGHQEPLGDGEGSARPRGQGLRRHGGGQRPRGLSRDRPLRLHRPRRLHRRQAGGVGQHPRRARRRCSARGRPARRRGSARQHAWQAARDDGLRRGAPGAREREPGHGEHRDERRPGGHDPRYGGLAPQRVRGHHQGRGAPRPAPEPRAREAAVRPTGRRRGQACVRHVDPARRARGQDGRRGRCPDDRRGGSSPGAGARDVALGDPLRPARGGDRGRARADPGDDPRREDRRGQGPHPQVHEQRGRVDSLRGR